MGGDFYGGAPKMKAFFITGTGTGVGKTLVTAALAYQLRRCGKRVAVCKPVVSGWDEKQAEANDTGQLLAALGRSVTEQEIEGCSPWRFTAPLSPDVAAAQEGRTIGQDELIAWSRTWLKQQEEAGMDYALMEGVGGVMVPLNNRLTVAGWMQALRLPGLLVGGGYLGSVSHTLSAREVLRGHGISIGGLILNAAPAESPVDPSLIWASLRPYMGEIPVFTFPRIDTPPPVWKNGPDFVPWLEHISSLTEARPETDLGIDGDDGGAGSG